MTQTRKQIKKIKTVLQKKKKTHNFKPNSVIWGILACDFGSPCNCQQNHFLNLDHFFCSDASTPPSISVMFSPERNRSVCSLKSIASALNFNDKRRVKYP